MRFILRSNGWIVKIKYKTKIAQDWQKWQNSIRAILSQDIYIRWKIVTRRVEPTGFTAKRCRNRHRRWKEDFGFFSLFSAKECSDGAGNGGGLFVRIRLSMPVDGGTWRRREALRRRSAGISAFRQLERRENTEGRERSWGKRKKKRFFF